MLLRDFRYALRVLARSPGFTVSAVAVLALAMGANTAIFSVLEGVLLRPLPYHDPQRLCVLWKTVPSRSIEWDWTSYPTIRDWREQSRAFEEMAVILRPEGSLVTMNGRDGAERIQASKVSGNFFGMLGVEPLLGRTFSSADSQNLVVLGFGFWQRRFGADRAVLGQTIELDNRSATIIGVMPRGFEFPDKATELWEPLTADPRWPLFQQPRFRIADAFCALGRLAPGASVEQARSEMNAISGRLAAEYPATDVGLGVRVVPLSEQIAGAPLRRALWLLSAGVFCVLLIACSNIASLLVSRGSARRRELAVRAALGAGRGQLIRQLAAESILLSIAGGLLGILLAQAGLQALLSRAPADLPRPGGIAINGTVLAFSFVLSLLTGIVFGLFPALQMAGQDLHVGLHEGGRSATAGARANRMRGLLVASQFALAIVLLTGAGLLVRSLLLLTAVKPGFDSSHLLTMTVQLPESGYEEALQQIEQLPGVRGAAFGSAQIASFIGNAPNENIVVEGEPATLNAGRHRREFVSDDYFRVLGIPLRQGRLLGPEDTRDTPRVAVINEAMARRFWGAANPIGKRFQETLPGTGGPWSKVGSTVVGIVGDVSYNRDGSVEPVFYGSIRQRSFAEMPLVVRTNVDPLSLVETIRRKVRSVDHITTTDQQLEQLDRPRSFQTGLIGVFAVVALALAALGMYGLISSSAQQRTREIGIRRALGASSSDVVQLIAGQGLKWVLAGMALGASGGLAFGKALSASLFGITATDPATLGAVIAILAVVAVLASVLPTWRATRVDPAVTLRHE